MIDIAAAVTASVKIAPGKLSLGESEHGPAVRQLVLENRTDREVTLDASHRPALATSGIIDPNHLTAAGAVTVDPSSVIIPPSGTETVSVMIDAPAAQEGVQYGGYVEFTDRDDGRMYRVPYAGFVGDYQSIRVLSDTPQGFPWLAKRINGRFYNRKFGAAFTLENSDYPYFLFHLDHQVRRVRLEVYDAASGKAWHRAWDTSYLTRNSDHTAYWYFGWNGTTTHGGTTTVVPNGTYRVRLVVQKALGDDDNPDHWESWDSPNVTIVRPDRSGQNSGESAGESLGLAAPQRLPSDVPQEVPR